MIIKLDSATSSDRYNEAVVFDRTNGSSSITPFDETLKKVKKAYSAWNSDNDKVIQASELSDEERAELYKKLGISSPSGVMDTTYSDNAVQYRSDSQSQSCTVNVPSKLVNVFKNASEKYGVSYDLLVSVAKAESGFNPNSRSSSGAMGIMQLMPATAKYLGVENAYDAESNIMGGARYLAEKLKKHGSVKVAVAAYNAGSGAVAKYGGVPPYAETQNYVKKVLSYMGSDGNESGLLEAVNTVKTVNADNNDTKESDSNVSAVEPEEANVQVAGVDMTYSAYLRYLELMDNGVS